MRRFMLVLVAVVGCGKPAAQDAVGDAELAEFRGSYPDAIAPTGAVRTYELVAEPVEIPLVDGRKLKVWAYNGQVPGPTLRVRLGETLRVHFTNRLPQETTIHWHGVRVPNGMDGVPNLTQPAVQPGETFTYEFTPKDAGTFWYHPHVRASEQVERGLYGPLIVEDASPPPYSSDEVLVLDDWRLDDTGQIDPAFNTRHDLAMDGRWGSAITVNGRTDKVLRVQPGARIRLRFLNTANGRVFAPDFGALDAKVIAVDGLYLREPVPAVGFVVAPGNRLDVDLELNQSTSEPPEIWDRFIPQRPNKLISIEIVGDVVDTPAFASPAHGHVPEWRGGLDRPVEHAFKLNAEQGGPFGIAWTIDGVAFAGHDHAMAGMAPMAPALTLERGRFYHLRFVNESARIHPIHLHGMFFRLLARNGVRVDEPFFRDTVLVHARETIDVGLVPTEAGTWMMHCHILEHAEAGMMTTISVIDGT
jgi:FtsP/CotA-like multicopper oxidase with cupredoxin domain